MLRSRSMPTGPRSYAEELEILQRKRAEKAAQRYPVSPEGPRASEAYYLESRYPEQHTRGPRASESRYPESRYPDMSRRESRTSEAHYSPSRYPEQVHHSRRAVNSVPDERPATPRRLDPSNYSPRKARVDPVGAEADRNTRYPRDHSESREQRLLDLEAQQKKRQLLLQQQMEHQQLQMQRQMYEQQMQRQRQMLEQQRQTVSRRKSTVKKTELRKADPKEVNFKRAGLYDRYAGTESTSGYSMYSDKYRAVQEPKKRSEPHAKPVKLGHGEFATPLAVVPATTGAVVASNGERQQLADIDVNIAESCPEDFMETMFMSPPSPPTIEETNMISEGVQEMTLASNDAMAKDSCGILMPDDDDVVVVPSMDWYGKAVPAAKESCVADFFHTLWTCR